MKISSTILMLGGEDVPEGMTKSCEKGVLGETWREGRERVRFLLQEGKDRW